jgi:hypothetical protein
MKAKAKIRITVAVMKFMITAIYKRNEDIKETKIRTHFGQHF